MRYLTKRRIQDTIILAMLAGCYLLAATESHAQACPQLAESGTYTATVPHQASGCTMALERFGPELGVGDLHCPGAPAPGKVIVGAPITPNPEGICILDLEIRTGGVLIAEEGEEVNVGSGFGLTEWVYTSDPLAVCQAAADAGLLVSGEIISLEAVLVTEYEPTPPDTLVKTFACQGTQKVWVGFWLESDFGPTSGGTINLIGAAEPVYLDGSLTIEAVGEAIPGLGVIESMTTPDATVKVGRGEYPAGTVTIQRAEQPL